MWIIDKFNILPTDKKFIDLFDEQKIALFEGVCSLPNQESLRRNMAISKKEIEIKSKKDSDFVKPGLKKRMEQTYKESGFTNEQIKNKIKEIADTQRKVELDKLEEIRNG